MNSILCSYLSKFMEIVAPFDDIDWDSRQAALTRHWNGLYRSSHSPIDEE